MTTPSRDQNVTMTMRFADSRGKLKGYVGPTKNYKGRSNPFGRAYEDLKTEALNWWVRETTAAAAEALKILMFYLGDYTAELIKNRMAVYGDNTAPVHVFTGSLIESIEAVRDDNETVVVKRAGNQARAGSLSWSIEVGIEPDAQRYERTGYEGPYAKNTYQEVIEYGRYKMDEVYEHQDIAKEVGLLMQDITDMEPDPSNWASAAVVSHISSKIHNMRQANQAKITASLLARVGVIAARQANSGKGGNKL